MSKYEDGLPPVSSLPQHIEPKERVEYEEQTIEVMLAVPKPIYEEFIEHVLKKEYSTISKYRVQFEIVHSMKVRIYLESLLHTPGTSIVRKLPDGSEQPILPVTGL